jgi:hypothetical protein
MGSAPAEQEPKDSPAHGRGGRVRLSAIVGGLLAVLLIGVAVLVLPRLRTTSDDRATELANRIRAESAKATPDVKRVEAEFAAETNCSLRTTKEFFGDSEDFVVDQAKEWISATRRNIEAASNGNRDALNAIGLGYASGASLNYSQQTQLSTLVPGLPVGKYEALVAIVVCV